MRRSIRDDKNVLTVLHRAHRPATRSPLDKGIELAVKLQEMTGYPEDPGVQQNLAQLYALKEEPGKADEEYGKDFIDDHLSSAIFALTGLRRLLDRTGQEPRERRGGSADVAAAGIGARKDVPSYYLSQVAGIYVKLNKDRQGPGRLRTRRRQKGLGRRRTPWRATPPSGAGRARTSRARPRPAGGRSTLDLRLLQQLRPRPGPVQAEEVPRGPQGRGEGRRAGQAHGREVRGLHHRAIRQPGQADQGGHGQGPEVKK
ncbi:MAG: hypothetical protein M0C28_07475 [Candidatus Moduliflexus flocculans]|nr:hypothetical protein [Candidatus Moduliflexus flocculans]